MILLLPTSSTWSILWSWKYSWSSQFQIWELRKYSTMHDLKVLSCVSRCWVQCPLEWEALVKQCHCWRSSFVTAGLLALSTGSFWCYALPTGAGEEAERACAMGVQPTWTAHGTNKATAEASVSSSKGKWEQAQRYLLQSDLSSMQVKSALTKNNRWPLKWKPTYLFHRMYNAREVATQILCDRGGMA